MDIVANEMAFAALLEGGSVVTWLAEEFDGASVREESMSGIEHVCAAFDTFAALKDGAVVCWGETHGPHEHRTLMKADGSMCKEEAQPSEPQKDLESNVVSVIHGWKSSSFTAVKDDGSVVWWQYDLYCFEHLRSGVAR